MIVCKIDKDLDTKESITNTIVSNIRKNLYENKTLSNYSITFSWWSSSTNEFNLTDAEEIAKAIINLADQRLYKWKNSGRNKVFLDNKIFI